MLQDSGRLGFCRGLDSTVLISLQWTEQEVVQGVEQRQKAGQVFYMGPMTCARSSVPFFNTECVLVFHDVQHFANDRSFEQVCFVLLYKVQRILIPSNCSTVQEMVQSRTQTKRKSGNGHLCPELALHQLPFFKRICVLIS